MAVEDDVNTILVQEGLVDDSKALHLLEAAGVAAVPGAAFTGNGLVNNIYRVPRSAGVSRAWITAGRCGMSSPERREGSLVELDDDPRSDIPASLN